ncbi:UNVERIFIED_CONTAM: hypothetical protein Sangu_0008900 [Sesamum angustifolium]|uniref:Uncharacterized protein n=1 Tax=Sesamum angustifolium TaxID=2727405 RepID=A0AAW2RHA5_9LAMI
MMQRSSRKEEQKNEADAELQDATTRNPPPTSDDKKLKYENSCLEGFFDPSTFAGPPSPVKKWTWTSEVSAADPDICESSSRWPKIIRSNTLKAKLMEARIEGQQSRARTSKGLSNIQRGRLVEGVAMAAATFRYLVQLHKDVPKAARFYSEGLGFTIDVCPCAGPSSILVRSSSLSCILPGAVERHGNLEQIGVNLIPLDTHGFLNRKRVQKLDGPIKHEIHGKVAAMRCADGHVLGLYEPA